MIAKWISFFAFLAVSGPLPSFRVVWAAEVSTRTALITAIDGKSESFGAKLLSLKEVP